jgi:hypothetical protein
LHFLQLFQFGSGTRTLTLRSTTLWKHLAGKKHKTAVQHYFAEYAPPPLYQPYRYWLKKSLLKYKLGQLARVNRARDQEGGLPATLVTRDSDVESSSRASSSSTLTHPSDSAPLSTTHAPREHSALTRGKCQSATRHIGPDTCHTQSPAQCGARTASRRTLQGGTTTCACGAAASSKCARRSGARGTLTATKRRATSARRVPPACSARACTVLWRAPLTAVRTALVEFFGRGTHLPYLVIELAAIHVDPELAKKGNIHTGVRPPWETDDEEPSSAPQVGPIVSLLAIARQKQRIQNKNPNRVGAEHANRVRLEQQGVTSEQTDDADPHWLPKFGRVFNAGSRADSRKEFDREQRKRKLDQR